MRINRDLEQARKGSILAGYNPPKPTGELATFVLYQEANLGHLMPEVQRYLYSLNERTLEELDIALNFNANNSLLNVLQCAWT